MSPVVPRCPCCELECSGQFLHCPRCGGGVAAASDGERLRDLLRRCRTLLRHRVWYGLGEALKAAQQRLADRPALRQEAADDLDWLGRDARHFALTADAADFGRVVVTAKGVLPLLPDGALPDLRDRLTRLNLLFASLDG